MTFSTTRRSRAARLIRTAHDNSTKSSGPHFPTFTRKSICKLPMDFRVKVGKCGPEDFVELSCAVLIRRAARLRRVVEKVIGEELVKHFKIPAALHLFGVPAHDRLRGLTRIVDRHGLLHSLLLARRSHQLSLVIQAMYRSHRRFEETCAFRRMAGQVGLEPRSRLRIPRAAAQTRTVSGVV